MKSVIIVGSARDSGNTVGVCKDVALNINADLINLNEHDVKPFDYEFKNKDDDFHRLMDKIMSYDNFILASPVYWFSPSAQLKAFIDRLSDFLTTEKEKGRKLRQKTAAVIATGHSSKIDSCFENIFKLTYKHLGIKHLGLLYCSFNEEVPRSKNTQAIKSFCKVLSNRGPIALGM